MNDASCVRLWEEGYGFSWRRVDASCEQTFPYLLLALFSKEKEEEARRARHPIGYPTSSQGFLYWLVVPNYPLNACANDSRENRRNHER